jgi:hypothetical protein
MKNPLEEIVGLRISKAEIVHDYLQLIFGEVACMTICNDYRLSGLTQPNSLTGLVLTDVYQNDNQVVMSFEGDVKMEISLLPEAYKGPEAMVLNREGLPTVVWN